ncbi:DUF2975 domain-containing protein [Microbacterium sp. LjRoot45]|uniref:DUF2975 domain-containing protein n=1 Tax=Microbacterium sp. LjRoot45 TaxID=3342329 RepID=UPI003ECFCCC2
MNRATTLTLRTLLAITLVLLVVAQVVALPTTASTWATLYPELAWLRAPGLVIAIAFIVCVQIVLVCLWRMLTLIDADDPFSARALRFITIIIAAIVAADLLLVVAVALLTAGNAANPSILLLGCFGIVVGAALALLVAVLRALLRKALELQHDLSEVV